MGAPSLTPEEFQELKRVWMGHGANVDPAVLAQLEKLGLVSGTTITEAGRDIVGDMPA